MRNAKINYLAVGVFVIAMLTSLIVAIVTLSGRTGAMDPYYATYDNVTGVKFGTQVMYEGYPIGQVESITPTAEDGRMRFRVDFEVLEGWKIPDDSRAEIAAPGLLSAITIAITAGESATPLEPGTQVTAREAADIFSVMSSVAGDISDLSQNSIKPLLANLNEMLGTDGKLLLTDLRDVTKDLGERIPRVAENVDHAVGQMSRILSDGNREKLENTIDYMDKAAVNMAQLTKDLKSTRAEVEKLVTSMNGVVSENTDNVNAAVKDLRYVADSAARHIDAVNQNLEGTARNMYEFSRQIRKNPGLLLGGTAPQEKAKAN